MKKTIALISCGKDKVDFNTLAKDLYTGDLFKKTRQYVEMQDQNFYILSALHGLTRPNEYLDPYDFTLVGADKAVKQRWASNVFRLFAYFHKPQDTVVAIYAGRDYRQYLVPQLEAAGYEVVLPLEGVGGIGKQKAFLKEKIEKGRV